MTRRQTLGFVAMAAILLFAAASLTLFPAVLVDLPLLLSIVLGAAPALGLMVLAHVVRGRIDPTYDAREAISGGRPGSTRAAATAVVAAVVGAAALFAIADDPSRLVVLAVALVYAFAAIWLSEHLMLRNTR